MVPDVRPQSTLRRLPWPRSPPEPFLVVPGTSPCSIPYVTPNNPSWGTEGLSTLEPHERGLLSSYIIPNPRGHSQQPSSTMSIANWDPKCTDGSQEHKFSFNVPLVLCRTSPWPLNMTHGARGRQHSDDPQSTPGHDPWPVEPTRNLY